MSNALSLSVSRYARVGLLCVALVGLNACSDMSAQQQRILSGAAIGTTAGALGTVAMGGCVACGAAIGGAVGAGAGYLYDYVDGKGY